MSEILIRSTFDRKALRRVCAMHESSFAGHYGMTTTYLDRPGPENYYNFRDHGSNILAVAHLDTVAPHRERRARFLNTAGGEVVYSRALDDRLGAYIILDWLPAMGIQFDILLTVGEESGMSTAEEFQPTKRYDWMIEFDRGGTDVVMYQYDDAETREAVRRSGARVSDGIFSDICYLEHLGIKGFNWGVGYRDYHGPRSHAYLEDTYMMMGHFLDFHEENEDVRMPHRGKPEEEADGWWEYGTSRFRDSKADDDTDFTWDPWERADQRRPGDDWLDADWIENPTLEQMQEFEAREARMLSEFDH